MMNDFGNVLDDCIRQTVDRVLTKHEMSDIEYIKTDNLGEVLEKLIILHIRTWMLEDAIQDAKTDAEVAEIKRKLDICFKIKRPNFVQAINLLVDDAIAQNKSLREDSVKLYKNVK
jgi:hypothetical protein